MRPEDADIAHVTKAVRMADLVTDPGPHTVIADLLPEAMYTLLLDTVPPPEGFEVADKMKANFEPGKTTGAPERSQQTWTAFHTELVDRVLPPLLLERFHHHVTPLYHDLFGPDLAADALRLPHCAFGGRLMLRRPGYDLKPHRDMKNAALTGLIYFARPGDSPAYGTDLFRVHNDRQAPFRKTFYPELFGGRAELARSVPFVANTALVFLNACGMAHGAHIPAESTQAMRLAYQFYVGITKSDRRRLVERMPPAQQAEWHARGKSAGEDGY